MSDHSCFRRREMTKAKMHSTILHTQSTCQWFSSCRTNRILKNLRLHRGKMSATWNTHPNLKMGFLFYRHQCARDRLHLGLAKKSNKTLARDDWKRKINLKKEGKETHDNGEYHCSSWKLESRNKLKGTAKVPAWPRQCVMVVAHIICGCWNPQCTETVSFTHPWSSSWIRNSTESGITKEVQTNQPK